MSNIVFSDNFNYKEKNFKSLYEFFQNNNISTIFDSSENDIYKKNWGDINDPSFTKLFSNQEMNLIYFYKGYNLKEIIESELLFVVANNNEFRATYFDDDIWGVVENSYKDLLKHYLFLARFWVDYWIEFFSGKDILAGITFGGSTVYSCAFLHVLKSKMIPCFVLEHFFTGEDFYCELRYSSIPNAAFFSRAIPSRKHWIDKIEAKKNKNVSKTPYQSLDVPDYYLIMGQVYNDFSLISKNNIYKNSIGFYKKLVSDILQNTKHNVVFKGHPYETEKIKNNLLTTVEELEYFRLTLPEEYRHRFIIITKYDLNGLIDGAKACITLTSQSGLEAIFRGKPVVTFGGAFYSNKGFTYDFVTPQEFITFIQSTEIYLTVKQVTIFNEYMQNVFDCLVGNNEVFKLTRLFSNLLPNEIDSDLKVITRQIKVVKNEKQKSNKENRPISKGHKRSYKRLFLKFKNNPKQFFQDSKKPFLNYIGRFF